MVGVISELQNLPSALLSLLSASRLLPDALLQNNNVAKSEDSELEYDDTDDIVLPDDAEPLYLAADDKAKTGKREPDDKSRQFECRHCGKRYRWKSTLRRHENVECGGKAPAHQCPYCTYRAKQRGNLGVHIRKHHTHHWHVHAAGRLRKQKHDAA